MDRLGPVVGRIAVTALVLLALGVASHAEEPGPPIENRPYRIALHIASDPAARLDARRRDEILARWREMVGRFVGSAWSVDVAENPSPLIGEGLEALKAEALNGLDPSYDKTWLVWIAGGPQDGSLTLTGREYDSGTRWLGPLQRRESLSPLDAPRDFFLFTADLFSPSALIVGQEGGRAILKVQGAAIPGAGEYGAIASPGTTFIPIRLVTMRDDSIRTSRIAFTYLTTESIQGATARCLIVSAFRDPLSQRIARPNTLAALGVKPGDSSLRFRFVDRATKGPAAGYTLTERPAPDGPPRDVGMTDRSGRIVVDPGPARGLVRLRLLAGDSEPLAEFPVMPGESAEEREITVDVLPLASKYQVQLDALRDGIVDQVALRGRLERLMQARAEGEDWAGLKELLREYALLPSPSTFAEALKNLKDEATRQSYQDSKTTVLTRHLQAEFHELQGLIDGYLVNDASQVFAEALRNATERKESAAVKKPATPKADAGEPAAKPEPVRTEVP